MKVSVIIPTFCRSPLLCEAIDSVLRQDVDGLELLVIDDGSTDDTEACVRSYGNPVHYIHQENQGLGSARNRGLSLAKGKYVAFLDDDDWWMPGKLKLQYDILEKLPDISGVFTNFSIYKAQDDILKGGIRTWFDSDVDWTNIVGTSTTLRDLLDKENTLNPTAYVGSIYEESLDQYFVLPSTALVRRRSIPDTLRFPLHDPICGDWEFFARLSRTAPLCFLDLDTTFNRSHADEFRLTRTKMIHQMEMRVDFLERVYMSDQTFYSNNRLLVDSVRMDRLVEICKLQLLESDRSSAHRTARIVRAIRASRTLKQRSILLAASVPGSSAVVRSLVGLRRMM